MEEKQFNGRSKRLISNILHEKTWLTKRNRQKETVYPNSSQK